MSQHPNNPYWCQNHDRPKAILSRRDWEEAEAGGYITADHVLDRLYAIAVREFGDSGPAAYDEEGFMIALTAEGIRCQGGVTLQVYNDHPPPHVHIVIKADPSKKLRINLETGEMMDEIPNGWAKKLKAARGLVNQNHSGLLQLWESKNGPITRG
ncbi:DUF4160 domain-containing protein [Nocardia sp. NPDC057668]|uniref:DUF4160 domain-containing protein n=1 Tax=Nocardia sp. NPDC057668 TaxID=3346202 RepID=UPI00366E9E3B